MEKLVNKKCVPCEGGVPPLTKEEHSKYLDQVKGWEVKDGISLERDFKFKDFKEALKFVNSVGKLAEEEGHHPDISLHGWNKVNLRLSTHAIGGLSENDFILASKINLMLEV